MGGFSGPHGPEEESERGHAWQFSVSHVSSARPITLFVLDDVTNFPTPKSGIAGFVGRPLWLEARSPFELRDLRESPLWQGDNFPAGHGRPALLMPGFLASSRSTTALEHVMRCAGWSVRTADVGRNAGPAHRSVDVAQRDLRDLAEETGQPVTVIGHSRGAQFSKILAVQNPDLVKQVIGLGTPMRVKYPMFFVMKVPAEILDKMWRWGVFGFVDKSQEDATEDLRFSPVPEHVDVVSIWSKNDGIVDWRLSLEPGATNIEIDASHLGMLSSVAGITAIGQGLSRQWSKSSPGVDSEIPAAAESPAMEGSAMKSAAMNSAAIDSDSMQLAAFESAREAS